MRFASIACNTSTVRPSAVNGLITPGLWIKIQQQNLLKSMKWVPNRNFSKSVPVSFVNHFFRSKPCFPLFFLMMFDVRDLFSSSSLLFVHDTICTKYPRNAAFSGVNPTCQCEIVSRIKYNLAAVCTDCLEDRPRKNDQFLARMVKDKLKLPTTPYSCYFLTT